MKRKYLSALLMGALTVTSVSTFTSCKDYDSDISNLQGQIDKAALKTEVEAMKTTVEAAKTAAESAKTTAEKALQKGDLDEIETKVKDLAKDVAKAVETGEDAKAAAEEAKDQCTELEIKFLEYYTAEEVDNLLDKLEAKIDANTEDIADLKAEVESYSGNINKLYSAVTSVSLVLSETGAVFGDDLTFDYGTMTPYSKATGETKDSYTFGEKEIDDLKGEHSATPTKTYKKGDFISFPDEILVRVNPVNANITKDMVKLVNSKGETLDDLLDITKVEKYDGYITKASTIGSGLWKVTVQPKSGVDASKIDQTTKVNGSTKNILHAVAINNTTSATDSSAASRYVVSSYELKVSKGSAYNGATNLDDAVIKTERGDVKVKEAVKTVNGPGTLVYAKNGENIEISFENLTNVDRFYVVRDDKHAGEDKSDASEINAWNKYSYEGLNEIVAVENGTGKGTFSVTIPSDAKSGDEIQFRIFAINYDGTLVSKEGESFRVYVGAETNVVKCEANAYFDAHESLTTGWQKITGTIADGLKVDNSSNQKQYYEYNTITANIQFTDNATKGAFNMGIQFAADENGKAATKNSDIKYFKVATTYNFSSWTDNGIATATIANTDKANESVVKITVTKVMPDVEDAKKALKYTWKDAQLVDGTYTAYLYPATTAGSADWTTASSNAYKYMQDAITDLDAWVGISIANAKWNETTEDYTDAVAADANKTHLFTIGAANALVDNKTAHVSTISYNFGAISSNADNKYNVDGNIVIPVETYNTVFACALDKDVQTYVWKQTDVVYDTDGSVKTPAKDVNVLTYGSGTTVDNVDLLEYIKATNKYDNKTFGGTLKSALDKYVSVESASLTSKESGKADYFTVNITKKATAESKIAFTPVTDKSESNPTGPVASTLTIVLKDAFGHSNTIELPFTVKRAE